MVGKLVFGAAPGERNSYSWLLRPMASAKMRSIALLQSLSWNMFPIHVCAEVHCLLTSLLVGRVTKAVMLVENGIATVGTRKDRHGMRRKHVRVGVPAAFGLRECAISEQTLFFLFAVTFLL